MGHRFGHWRDLPFAGCWSCKENGGWLHLQLSPFQMIHHGWMKRRDCWRWCSISQRHLHPTSCGPMFATASISPTSLLCSWRETWLIDREPWSFCAGWCLVSKQWRGNTWPVGMLQWQGFITIWPSKKCRWRGKSSSHYCRPASKRPGNWGSLRLCCTHHLRPQRTA